MDVKKSIAIMMTEIYVHVRLFPFIFNRWLSRNSQYDFTLSLGGVSGAFHESNQWESFRILRSYKKAKLAEILVHFFSKDGLWKCHANICWSMDGRKSKRTSQSSGKIIFISKSDSCRWISLKKELLMYLYLLRYIFL